MRPILTEGAPLVLHLQFPAEWRQSRNPLAESAAAWARTLLSDFGLTRDAEAQQLLEKLDLAGFGWPFPNADRHLLCTTTAFLGLWVLYEARLAASGEEDEAALIAAVRGDGTRPADAYHAAFWEIAQRYSRKLGRPFLARHGERFRAWLHASRDGRPERAAAALLPILDFLELDLGEDLPATLAYDPRLATLERLTGEVVALQAALGSYLRDAEDNRPNAVCRAQAEEGLDGAGACALVVRRHNDLVRQLDRTGRALALAHRSAALTAWWIRLGGLVAGFGRRLADRLRGRLVAGGRELRFSLDDDGDIPVEESPVTTAVFKVPQIFVMMAAPLG